MRIKLVLAVFLLGISHTKATGLQESNDSVGKKTSFSWGVKAGFELAALDSPVSTHPMDLRKGGLGAVAGVYMRCSWKSGLYVQPGLNISFSNTASPLKESEITGPDSYLSVNRGVLTLPVHVGYRFGLGGDMKMSVFTGVFGSYSFAGTCTLKNQGHNPVVERPVLYGEGGILRRWSVGPAFGVTFESDDYPLSVYIHGYVGLNKLNRTYMFRYSRICDNNMSVGFAYRFH